MRKQKQIVMRTCIECGVEYTAVQQNSRFCSSTCRAEHWRVTKRSETQDGAHDTQNSTHKTGGDTHELANTLSPDLQQPDDNTLGLQFAVDLLRDQSDRWYSAFQEERTKRKILQEELVHAKEELARAKEEPIRLKELHAFETLENKKPDMLERMLTGIGSLPSPLLEQLLPLVGRLGNLVIPPQRSAPLSGISNQTQLLIGWIQSLPEEVRHRLLAGLQSISELSEVDLIQLLDEIHKYLERGIRVMRPPTSGL